MILKKSRKNMEKEIKISSDFVEYKNAFLAENAKHNLISKNNEKFLYEKHFYDSLGIKLFFEKYINNVIKICKFMFIFAPISVP